MQLDKTGFCFSSLGSKIMRHDERKLKKISVRYEFTAYFSRKGTALQQGLLSPKEPMSTGSTRRVILNVIYEPTPKS